MKFVGSVLAYAILFVIAVLVFHGLPEIMDGQFFLDIGLSAAIYAVVQVVVSLLLIVVVIGGASFLGGLVGATVEEIEGGAILGGCVGFILVLLISWPLSVYILGRLGQSIEFFPEFLVWQRWVFVLVCTAIGVTSAASSSSSKSKSKE